MKQRSDAIVDYQSFRDSEGRYVIACKTCSKSQVVSKQTLRRRFLSLSKECRSCAQSHRDNPNFHVAQKKYASSVKKPDRPIFHRNDLRAWARQVHKQCNYSCAMCGENKHLEAHHIIPKILFPEWALIVTNGISLCKSCHKVLHKKLGYLKPNQKPQEVYFGN